MSYLASRGCGSSDLKAKGDGLCDFGATFGHPWATFGHPWGPFSYLVPTLGRGPGALGPLVGESLEKGTQNERNGDPKWAHFRRDFELLGKVTTCIWTAQA